MRILGIDPGYGLMGFGVVDFAHGRFSVIDYGSVYTEPGMAMPERLKFLYASLMDVIADTEPEVCAIEELFYNTNAKTVINVGQARGVAVLAAVNSGLTVAEYTPLQIKQALTGYGRAEKKQVQEMVKNILKLKSVPRPDDTADALAVAVCHAYSDGGAGGMSAAIEKALAKEAGRGRAGGAGVRSGSARPGGVGVRVNQGGPGVRPGSGRRTGDKGSRIIRENDR